MWGSCATPRSPVHPEEAIPIEESGIRVVTDDNDNESVASLMVRNGALEGSSTIRCLLTADVPSTVS